MFKKIENTVIATYRYGCYIVEIHDVDGNYEMWIQHEEYCVKEMVFGAPKFQQSYEEFVEIAEANMPFDIEAYEEEYFEDDED